jgi:hypothetical protein
MCVVCCETSGSRGTAAERPSVGTCICIFVTLKVATSEGLDACASTDSRGGALSLATRSHASEAAGIAAKPVELKCPRKRCMCLQPRASRRISMPRKILLFGHDLGGTYADREQDR